MKQTAERRDDERAKMSFARDAIPWMGDVYRFALS
jgi:hypothetical protein